MRYKNIYDISLILGPETADLPEIVTFDQRQMEIDLIGEIFRGTSINIFAHAGTHVDAPCHLVPHRKTLDQYPLSRFIVPATVVEIKDLEAIRPQHIADLKLMPGQALLFKTENSKSGRAASKVLSMHYTYMTPEALEMGLKKGVALFGFDFGNAEKPGGEGAPLHHRCFQADAIILEGLNLRAVPEGDYTLVALPLRIEGIDGCPVRAVLLS